MRGGRGGEAVCRGEGEAEKETRRGAEVVVVRRVRGVRLLPAPAFLSRPCSPPPCPLFARQPFASTPLPCPRFELALPTLTSFVCWFILNKSFTLGANKLQHCQFFFFF